MLVLRIWSVGKFLHFKHTRWWMAAILKNEKSQYVINHLNDINEIQYDAIIPSEYKCKNCNVYIVNSNRSKPAKIIKRQ